MDQRHTRFDALVPQTANWQSSPRPVGQRRWWHPLASGVALLLVGLGVGLGSAPPAHAQDIPCGSVLGPGGRYRLQGHLECPETGVTIQDGALLDLNGYMITCGSGPCVLLTGEGARLRNGVVDGGDHESIVLAGTGGHTVRNITSTFVDFNIWVRSDRNVLINVVALSAYSPAIYFEGNRNRLEDSTAECSHTDEDSFGCLTVDGNQNRLTGNIAANASGHKIVVAGDRNVLLGNRALYPLDGPSDQYAGIVVSGTGNRLESNTALDNRIDLVDTHGDCAHNTWGRNSFRTSDPACIGGSAVGAPVAQVPQ
jgi:hypothetical protein